MQAINSGIYENCRRFPFNLFLEGLYYTYLVQKKANKVKLFVQQK